jgi:hypothetical protein
MAIDLKLKDYKPMNKTDEENMEACKWLFPQWLKLMTNSCGNADDLALYHGAPVGLQIVTRKHEEEKAWAIAKVVMAALRTARVE